MGKYDAKRSVNSLSYYSIRYLLRIHLMRSGANFKLSITQKPLVTHALLTKTVAIFSSSRIQLFQLLIIQFQIWVTGGRRQHPEHYRPHNANTNMYVLASRRGCQDRLRAYYNFSKVSYRVHGQFAVVWVRSTQIATDFAFSDLRGLVLTRSFFGEVATVHVPTP